MPSPLDSTVESLKDKVLRINEQTETVTRDVDRPAYRRINLYFGVLAPALLVDKIKITLDNGPERTVEYDRGQAIALLNGVDRILSASADPGIHQVHVEVSGQYSDAKTGDAPVVKTLDIRFRKDSTPTDIELDLIKPRYSSTPTLHAVQWAPAS